MTTPIPEPFQRCRYCDQEIHWIQGREFTGYVHVKSRQFGCADGYASPMSSDTPDYSEHDRHVLNIPKKW